MWYSLTCWQLMAWQQGQDVLCEGGDKNGSIANDSSALPCFCNGSLSFSPLSFAPSSNYNIKGKGYPLKLERGVHFSWARFMQGQTYLHFLIASSSLTLWRQALIPNSWIEWENWLWNKATELTCLLIWITIQLSLSSKLWYCPRLYTNIYCNFF